MAEARAPEVVLGVGADLLVLAEHHAGGEGAAALPESAGESALGPPPQRVDHARPRPRAPDRRSGAARAQARTGCRGGAGKPGSRSRRPRCAVGATARRRRRGTAPDRPAARPAPAERRPREQARAARRTRGHAHLRRRVEPRLPRPLEQPGRAREPLPRMQVPRGHHRSRPAERGRRAPRRPTAAPPPARAPAPAARPAPPRPPRAASSTSANPAPLQEEPGDQTREPHVIRMPTRTHPPHPVRRDATVKDLRATLQQRTRTNRVTRASDDKAGEGYAARASGATGFSTATRAAMHEWAWIARGLPWR